MWRALGLEGFMVTSGIERVTIEGLPVKRFQVSSVFLVVVFLI